MSQNEIQSSVAALAALPGISEKVDAAREACTQLRWHNALRRRIPEAAAESRVRGARASGELDGARLSVEIVRDLMRGAVTWHDDPDPVEQVMRGVLAATAETERLGPVVLNAPMQALARLHTAAAAGLVPDDELGRPRKDGEDSREFLEISPAPSAAEARDRLQRVVELLAGAASLPVPIVAAVAHAEIITARPFTRGNGVVARAVERAVIQAGGLDPTGVAVPEVGHGAGGGPAYFGGLTAYVRGDAAGVGLWLAHSCDAIVAGAQEGERIADAVLAGRLS
ncbi:oxidoreductase [Knoellia sinensis KCTC 19936]|uniref:Oxidoreductase n=1 Tax=Knoellia sinensis KCTC 19936 TaxID=1385520 RepID=A0A0A0J919_9MICO|nr:Fic family protein [Knoellia sinensis]KGN32101.1 oxidoreductase [Knoellia sinensis KCTC 19936]